VGAKHGAALGLASCSAGDHGVVFQVLQSVFLKSMIKKLYAFNFPPHLL